VTGGRKGGEGYLEARCRRRDVTSWSSFFFFFFFFLNHVLLVKIQELACIMRYGVRKTLIPTTARFTSSWEKSNTPNP